MFLFQNILGKYQTIPQGKEKQKPRKMRTMVGKLSRQLCLSNLSSNMRPGREDKKLDKPLKSMDFPSQIVATTFVAFVTGRFMVVVNVVNMNKTLLFRLLISAVVPPPSCLPEIQLRFSL